MPQAYFDRVSATLPKVRASIREIILLISE